MAKAVKKFYTIKNIRAENGTSIGRLDIYGEIAPMEFWGDEVTPKGLVDDLNKLGNISEIECHIFSYGGDMFAGLAIYNILYSRPETVSIYIEGVAASAAAIIACSGDKVYMRKSDMIYYHNMLSDPGMINEHEARDLVEEFEKLKEAYVVPFMNKSGKTCEEIIALLDGKNKKGTWLTADEAIAFGLCDAYTPINKIPSQMAACISPGVFNYRGYKIDFSGYDKAAEKTAGIINSSGGNLMAFPNPFKKKNGKPAAKKTNVKPKAEITFVETVCPSCSGAVNLNPNTGEVFAGGAQQVESGTDQQNGDAQGDTTQTVLARRMPGNIKTALFSICCPHCGEDYVWDTDVNADGESGTTASPSVPIGGNQQPAQKPAEQQTEPAAEAAQAACPNCGAQVDYDTETAETGVDEATGAEGYLLTCTGCNTQFIEPKEAADPNSVPVGASAKEQNAYKAGVMAERNRQSALDEMAQAAPALSAMITAAKKSGTSAETMSRNVIRAMAQGKGGVANIGTAKFAAAIARDVQASGVNTMRKPNHAAAPQSVGDAAYERFAAEYNKGRGGKQDVKA
ncbi:MAG: Clp protease ClpP [Treponema sp.]|nr:Clp protease ClpP [Treponema sp.]